MFNKKHFLLFTASIFLLVLISNLVSADCCVSDSVGCIDVATPGECSFEYYTDACSTVCEIGCCCEPLGGMGRLRYLCNETQYTFVANSSVSNNQWCPLCGLDYTISGTVTRKSSGTRIGGATVSARTKTTTSATDGTYTLTNVPEGTNVLVAAHRTPCVDGTQTIPALNQDTSSVNIEINCDCTPETCNYNAKSYCMSDAEWDFYDLSNPAQNATYCSFCSLDPDCGQPPLCVDGDGVCPVSCTPSTDSDCVCSTTANGYCPPGCTPANDADCVSLGVCGNRLVEYPYETCEDNPYPGQMSLCGAEDCINEGLIGECNCLSLSGCGDFLLEADEECEIGMLCPDGTACENCTCGTPTCEGGNMNPSLSTRFDAIGKKIQVTWTLLGTCIPSVAGYSVFKCHKQASGDCVNKNTGFGWMTDVDTPLNMSVYDANILGSSNYCYYVKAFYKNGDEGESGMICEETGYYRCMETHPDEFCVDNWRSRCKNNYQLDKFLDCGADHCMGPDRDEETWCESQGVCDFCNGLYGMFSNLDLKVRLQEGEHYFDYYCHYNPSQPNRDVVSGCYLDRTQTLFSAFDYCANIDTCYDYKSHAACTDIRDPCGKRTGCEWIWLNNIDHTQGGICRPINPELQQCDLCDEKEYNWISPSCNPTACSLFGDCYYQGSSTRAEPCAKQSTFSCLDYNTSTQCTGSSGTAVHVNANYDADGNRTGGNHQLTPSNDKFELGKCYWDSSNNRCRRNADNYPENNAANIGHDCNIGDYHCESDFDNPETIILSSASGCGKYPTDVKLRYGASDNKYSSSDISTYFCIAPSSGSKCYPSNLATGSVYEETITTSGTYTVRYYSEDYAKNLEEVQEFNIEVDADPPIISEIISPSEAEFPTSGNRVTIKARTSVDTMNICSYKYGSTQKNCINTCAYGQGYPCIDPSTGEFEMNITIPSQNALFNILFDAEDCAGNKVTGQSLLAIYRNDTQPAQPVIIIQKAS